LRYAKYLNGKIIFIELPLVAPEKYYTFVF